MFSHLGKVLNKYYTKKYGKNFERAEKKYELIYNLQTLNIISCLGWVFLLLCSSL